MFSLIYMFFFDFCYRKVSIVQHLKTSVCSVYNVVTNLFVFPRSKTTNAHKSNHTIELKVTPSWRSFACTPCHRISSWSNTSWLLSSKLFCVFCLKLMLWTETKLCYETTDWRVKTSPSCPVAVFHKLDNAEFYSHSSPVRSLPRCLLPRRYWY